MKTIRNLAILVCALFTGMNVNAQQVCGTASPAPPSWLFNPTLRSVQVTPSNFTLKVFIHIVRNSSGSGGVGTGAVSAIVSQLNTDYAGTGISFQSAGYDFIDNNTYYADLASAEYTSLWSTNSHNTAIDIYVLGTSTTAAYLGLAENIPSSALWIHGSVHNTSVVSHEVGHCLGLYHTHHGTVFEPGLDINQCAELVGGSNATTCGDYLQDTPADPNIWSLSGCSYAGSSSVVDGNGQPYNPNPSNYMSYSDHGCWSLFTTDQKQRMRDMIANELILQRVISYTLSSSASVVCSGSSATFTVSPAPSSFTWDKSSNLTLVSSSGNSATFSASGSGSGWVRVMFNGSEVAQKTLTLVSYPPSHSSATAVCTTYGSNTYIGEATVLLASAGIDQFEWSSDNAGWSISEYGTNTISMSRVLITKSTSATTIIRVRPHNACGWGDWSPVPTPGSSYYSASAYPNPVDGTLTVDILVDQQALANALAAVSSSGSFSSALSQNPVFQIKLYSSTGTLVKETTSPAGAVTIDVSNLPSGTYFLQVYDGAQSEPLTQTIIVSH
jgi:hypothetical protein